MARCCCSFGRLIPRTGFTCFNRLEQGRRELAWEFLAQLNIDRPTFACFRFTLINSYVYLGTIPFFWGEFSQTSPGGNALMPLPFFPAVAAGKWTCGPVLADCFVVVTLAVRGSGLGRG